jgi:hypothetical protein
MTVLEVLCGQIANTLNTFRTQSTRGLLIRGSQQGETPHLGRWSRVICWSGSPGD